MGANAIQHKTPELLRHFQGGVFKCSGEIGVDRAIGDKQRAHAAPRFVFGRVHALMSEAGLRRPAQRTFLAEFGVAKLKALQRAVVVFPRVEIEVVIVKPATMLAGFVLRDILDFVKHKNPHREPSG